MKHIFYVHSGITYIVSRAAIEHLKLEVNDVVIIIARSVHIDEKFPSIKLNTGEDRVALLPTYGSRGVLTNWNVLYKLDRKVADAVMDNKFILYLPSEKNYLMQFLQSHRLCMKRNFIEEGLLTYRAGFVKPRVALDSMTARLRHFFRYPFHLYRTDGVPKDAEKTFTIYVATRTALRVLCDYDTVLLDVNKVETGGQPQPTSFNALHIFDAVVEMNLCSNDNFMKCLDDFVAQHMPRKGLAIKFHPFQKRYDQYLAIFDKHNIQYTVLGPDVIPEVLLAERKKISVYGLTSSVLFYAKEMGHEVHSFSPVLTKKDVAFNAYVKELIPKSIIEYLNLI